MNPIRLVCALVFFSLFGCATSGTRRCVEQVAPTSTATTSTHTPAVGTGVSASNSGREMRPEELAAFRARQAATRARYAAAFEHSSVVFINLPEDSVGQWWHVSVQVLGNGEVIDCDFSRAATTCTLPMRATPSDQLALYAHSAAGNAERFTGRLLVRTEANGPVTEYRTIHYEERTGTSGLAPVASP